jgi:hypothetical protein
MHEKPNLIILKLAFNVKNMVLQHQYQSSPLDPILNQGNPVYLSAVYFTKFHFTITLPFAARMWLPFRVLNFSYTSVHCTW